MENAKTAFIYYGEGGHTSHEGFQESIEADALYINKRDLPVRGLLKWPIDVLEFSPERYDYYVIEYAAAIFAAPIIKREHPNAKIILLLADPSFLKPAIYDNNYRPDKKKAILVNSHWALTSTITSWIATKNIDGVISVSKFALNRFRKHLKDIPYQISHPYIGEKKRRLLQRVEPNLKSNRAVMIGGERTYKGIGLLMKAWPLVRKQVPNATLHVVGAGHSKKRESISGVSICGYISDDKLAQELSEASLYVHPANLETFGVAVIESLCGGVPTIVTESTGSKTIVEQLDPNLITNTKAEELASTVVNYFKSTEEYKWSLSNEARELASGFDERTKKKEFKKSFEILTNKMPCVYPDSVTSGTA